MNSEIYSRKRNNVDCSGLKSIEVIYTVITSFLTPDCWSRFVDAAWPHETVD